MAAGWEPGTGNQEPGTGNRERGTRNGEPGMGNGPRPRSGAEQLGPTGGGNLTHTGVRALERKAQTLLYIGVTQRHTHLLICTDT